MTNSDPIQVSQVFEVSAESLWLAITDVTEMRQWYFSNLLDFKAEVGFETQFLIQNEGRNFTHIWKVKEVIPNKFISYSWNFEEHPGEGLTTFEIETKEGKTTLTLKSFVIKAFPNDIPEFKRESGQAGWDYLIKESLANFLSK